MKIDKNELIKAFKAKQNNPIIFILLLVVLPFGGISYILDKEMFEDVKIIVLVVALFLMFIGLFVDIDFKKKLFKSFDLNSFF